MTVGFGKEKKCGKNRAGKYVKMNTYAFLNEKRSKIEEWYAFWMNKAIDNDLMIALIEEDYKELMKK